MTWSLTNEDVRTVKLTYGELTEIFYKDHVKITTFDPYSICVEYSSDYNGPINNVNRLFRIYSYCFGWNECIDPIGTSQQDLIDKLNLLLSTSSVVKVAKNGTVVGLEPAINLIEGSNITLTVTDNTLTDSIDVTIDASGGGGGLPPDGTYGDVVVSGAGTIWTVTDDTSNQQVAVYEDGFIRGTRPSLNFYDDGGIVSVTVADNPGNNAVDIGISTTLPGPVYLVAHDENTQTAASRDTGYPMSIHWTDESNGITINSHTEITFSQDGVYNIQFSAQFSNNDTQLHDVDIWFQKNDAPIPWSNSRFTINASHGGDAGHHIAAWNFMSTFLAGDFVEIYWETDDVQVVIEKIAAANDAPDTPSIILTVDKL